MHVRMYNDCKIIQMKESRFSMPQPISLTCFFKFVSLILLYIRCKYEIYSLKLKILNSIYLVYVDKSNFMMRIFNFKVSIKVLYRCYETFGLSCLLKIFNFFANKLQFSLKFEATFRFSFFVT